MEIKKGNNVLVSVLIPTYNHEFYIAQCIRSILIQRVHFKVQIIIGDDGSTDRSPEIIIEQANLNKDPDKEILLLLHPNNLSHPPNIPARLNFISCLEKAEGKYIALCEGDDYWIDPLKLQKQVDFLEANPDCISCHHWHRYAVKAENGQYKEIEAPTENQGYYPFLKSTVREIFANKLRVKTRTHMFRNVIKQLPEWFMNVAYGDVALSMVLGEYGSFGFINEPMAVYRQTDSGISCLDVQKKNYHYIHNRNWIQIWEGGLIHHKYQYKDEAMKTIAEFYKEILQKEKSSPITLGNLMIDILWRSKLKLLLRLKLLASMSGYFLNRLIFKLKAPF